MSVRLRVLAGALMCVAGGVSAAPAEAPPAKPEDFAYGMKFDTRGVAAAYIADVPTLVYQGVALSNLADIAVFNGRLEVVPHLVSVPRTPTTVSVPPVALPVFPLRGDPGPALDAIRVTIEAAGAKVNIQAPASDAQKSAADPEAITGYVIDGRELKGSLSALEIAWPDDAPQFAGRLRIEGSDDLGYWQTLVDGAPIANLRAGESQLVERRIETRFMRSRFWRLSWVGKRAPFEITSVVAEPAGSRQDIARTSLTFDGKPVAGKPGEFEFDLGARFPVDRVNLELPELNSIVDVQLLVRATQKGPWQPVDRSGFYRLASGDAELVNGDVAIPLTLDRYWLVRADVRGNPLGRGVPKLRVAWAAHEITFLARGPAPFMLAFGNASASAAAGRIPALPRGASVLHAPLGERQTLGGPSRLTPANSAMPNRSTVLWIVLGVAVAMLAYMAYRLSRDLKR